MGVVVVPDRGGQNEESLQDADGYPVRGAAAVASEVQLSLEGLNALRAAAAVGLGGVFGAAADHRVCASRHAVTPRGGRC